MLRMCVHYSDALVSHFPFTMIFFTCGPRVVIFRKVSWSTCSDEIFLLDSNWCIIMWMNNDYFRANPIMKSTTFAYRKVAGWFKMLLIDFLSLSTLCNVQNTNFNHILSLPPTMVKLPTQNNFGYIMLASTIQNTTSSPICKPSV